jgi:hypothetical protein
MPLQLSPFQSWHLVEHFSNHPLIILYAPTFGIHVKTATTHKDIGLTTSFLQPVNGYVSSLQVPIDPQYAWIEKPGKGEPQHAVGVMLNML